MEEEKIVEVVKENEPTQTTETPTVNAAGKVFTQEEVDALINNRFKREREKVEKEIKEKTASLIEKEQILMQENESLKQVLTQKERTLLGYQKGIANDKIEEALVLAELKATKMEITLDEALNIVADEFPNLARVGSKAGVEIKNKPAISNPYWTDEMKKRHPDLYAKVKGK